MQNTLAVRLLRGSFFLVLALFASFVPGLLGYPRPPSGQNSLADIATILALFMQGVIWANIIIAYYIQRYVRVHVTDGSAITTFKALGVVARLTIWIVLGLAGLAIALAIQNILGDLFAAISIVMDKPFVVGDSISVENYRGKVEHIGLKTTRVRSESGEQIIFSNGELLKSKIRNYSR